MEFFGNFREDLVERFAFRGEPQAQQSGVLGIGFAKEVTRLLELSRQDRNGRLGAARAFGEFRHRQRPAADKMREEVPVRGDEILNSSALELRDEKLIGAGSKESGEKGNGGLLAA